MKLFFISKHWQYTSFLNEFLSNSESIYFLHHFYSVRTRCRGVYIYHCNSRPTSPWYNRGILRWSHSFIYASLRDPWQRLMVEGITTISLSSTWQEHTILMSKCSRITPLFVPRSKPVRCNVARSLLAVELVLHPHTSVIYEIRLVKI